MVNRSINDDASQVYMYYTKTPISAPSGTKQITANGTGIDVAAYATADVNVSNNLGTKSIVANGTYNASSDSLDGYSQVVVDVPSSATGTIDITSNANGINVSSYAYADVNVPSPSYVKNPMEFDYNIGYVDKDSNNYGIWKYESPTNTYSDIYTIENGKTYLIGFGDTVSTRARGCITQTDVRTLGSGSQTTGEAPLVGMYSGTIYPGNVWKFTAPFDGYFVFAKSNNGTSGVQSYFYCVDDMTDAEPSGTKSITANGDGIDVAGYSAVNVHVPGTTPPSGTKEITANGTGIDVAAYAYADVAVPGIVPTGTLPITDNGTYDVTNYASATVNVSGGGGGLPSNMTMQTVNVTADTETIEVSYDPTKTVGLVIAVPTALQLSAYEYTFIVGKRNFFNSNFDQLYGTYVNYNHTGEQNGTGTNAGNFTFDSTNGIITIGTKSSTYHFKTGDSFVVFIAYLTQS